MTAPNPVVDSTAQLNALIASHQRIPAGTYPFAGQLRIPPGCNLEGTGPLSCILNYTGPARADGCIISGAGSWGYEAGGFSLSNTGPSKGQGVGIGLGTDTSQVPNGNQVNAGLWHSVHVDGFGTGIQLGDAAGRAASEMIFTLIQVEHCDIGVQCQAWNTLNLQFHNLMVAFCRRGLDCTQATNVHVNGMSCGGITDTPIRFSQSGVFSVRGLRTETSRRLIVCTDSQSAGMVSISDCQATSPANNDGIDIEIGIGGGVEISNCILQGKVRYTYGDDPRYPLGFGSVNMTSVKTFGKILLDGPAGTKCPYSLRSCALLDGMGSPIATFNQDGIIGDGPVPLKPVPIPTR